MDLMQIGKQLIGSKLGGGANSEAITSALDGLLAGKSGNPDLSGLISAMQSKGLGSVASSWLGDGQNEDISADQVRDVVGSEKVAAMAEQLHTDEGSLLDGLKEALPQIIDKSSSGGSLLDNAGDLLGMARKLF